MQNKLSGGKIFKNILDFFEIELKINNIKDNTYTVTFLSKYPSIWFDTEKQEGLGNNSKYDEYFLYTDEHLTDISVLYDLFFDNLINNKKNILKIEDSKGNEKTLLIIPKYNSLEELQLKISIMIGC